MGCRAGTWCRPCRDRITVAGDARVGVAEVDGNHRERRRLERRAEPGATHQRRARLIEEKKACEQRDEDGRDPDAIHCHRKPSFNS